jgi:FKBP-type peptidyl-prolyl cis-trans isomerase FklB
MLLAAGAAAEEAGMNDPVFRVSYSLGYQIGQDLKREGLEFREDSMRRGLRDGLSGASPALDSQEMKQVLLGLKKKLAASERGEEQQRTERRREEDRKFFSENAKREGVVDLPKGLQYQVLREGTGKKPGANDRVKIHYRGPRVVGEAFDKAMGGKTATYKLDTAIPGLGQALSHMQEGALWRVFIPAALAYDERGPMRGRAVVFEVELISVEPAQ